MSHTDLEMEDVEQTHDSGQNPESKVPDSSGGAGVATENGTYDGGGELDKPCHEEMIGLKYQINLKIQANEQIECPDNDLVSNIDCNALEMDINTKDEELAVARSTLEKQIDVDNGVVEPKSSEGEANEGIQRMDSVDALNDSRKAGYGLNEDIVNKNVEETYEGAYEPAKVQQTLDVESGVLKEDSKLPADEVSQRENGAKQAVLQGTDKEVKEEDVGNQTTVYDQKGQCARDFISRRENDVHSRSFETTSNNIKDSSVADQHEASTPNSIAIYSPGKAGVHSGETIKAVFTPTSLSLMVEGDDGTPEEQASFVKEVESFYKEKAMDFKQPKFYGQPLNCLKLWRAVIGLGGYDKVTGSKLWRQVGESFHPPKTCTTVSWTFRIFYEKSLLEYERHLVQSGELQLPPTALPEASGIDGEGSGSGRAGRDSAARAVQGWHVQRLYPCGEAGEPVMKEKNPNNAVKREKMVKSSGSLKQKRAPEVEYPNKAIRTETSKQGAGSTILDVGAPAEWVKINVLQTQDCFEVYALVPGLLREEVRVQSDPAGRVVITGQPENLDNPWGITPFKKVITLSERIDPLQTSAVVSMHGRLFVRVPFEQQQNNMQIPQVQSANNRESES